VTALAPVRLYALTRDQFVAAVSRHPASADAAETVIGERLGTLRAGPAPA
jgi:hypothetical protein